MSSEDSKLYDQIHKILSGINRTFEDPAVPEFDKELLKKLP